MCLNIIREIFYSIYFSLFRKHTLPQLTPAQRWMIAAGGNLVKLNSAPFATLHYGRSRGGMRSMLRQWWDVRDRPSLLDQLQRLANEGHRTTFQQAFTQVANLTEADIARVPNPAARFVWENRHNFKNGDLVAWDFARLINVARQGYTAGYINEQEAWQYIAPAARILQSSYSSWHELSDNYMLGWRFWQNGAPLDAHYIRTFNWLKTDPASPWAQIAWNTPLG